MKSPLHVLSRVGMLDLADALAAGRLVPPYTPLAVAAWVPSLQGEDIAGELEHLRQSGLQPHQIASVLNLLATERELGQRVTDRLQLVWTGPEVPGSVSRDTGVVVRELLTSARHSLLLSTFTIHRGAEVFAPLATAIKNNLTLRARLVVNVGRNGDYVSSQQHLLDKFASEFWKEDWPWSPRPLVYYDPRSLSLEQGVTASLHAKCIVVDDETAFVTSANFTERAQERNVEAGVLVRDPQFARALRQQFDALIGASHLLLLPGT